MNRAFSAGAFGVPLVLGRCPRLTVDAAPLALKQLSERVPGELDSVLRAIWFALEERQKNNPSPSSSPFGKGRGEVHVPSVE